jgi:broad-specificity NMP kinase
MENNEKGKPFSLLDHMEKIVSFTGKKGFGNIFWEKARPHLEVVGHVLELSPQQSALFAHFLNLSDDPNIRLVDLAESIHCNTIQLLRFMDDLDTLVDRKLIKKSEKKRGNNRSSDQTTFRVTKDVINAIRMGEAPKPKKKDALAIEDFYSTLSELFTERNDDELDFEDLMEAIRELLADNRHLALAQRSLGYGFGDEDLALLLRFCVLFIDDGDDMIGTHNYADVYSERQGTLRQIERSLKNGDHILITSNLVEPVNNDGFSDQEYFKLTDKAKTELLSELQINTKKRGKDFILAKNVKTKHLFYNERESRSIAELTDLLKQDTFLTVQSRLAGEGMRKGFACLFYGPPGTGKTETAYQIARQTDRDIMAVNLAETKSMWYGESEKKIKAIFDRYRAAANSSDIAPILLFNEADGVIGKRKEINGANRTIDQTENTIQNIILQEIENLEGILIATTNMNKNMDKAFERRFLYKVEFETPSIVARRAIWKAIITDLSDDDATTLAGEYNFSGGQIENIARKRTVKSILAGETPTLVTLRAYCQEELLEKDASVMGFKMTANT